MRGRVPVGLYSTVEHWERVRRYPMIVLRAEVFLNTWVWVQTQMCSHKNANVHKISPSSVLVTAPL